MAARSWKWLFVAALAFAARAPARAAADRLPAASLDKQAVHARYNGGDFEDVIAALEAFVKSHQTCSREDSTFVAKHLGVVYAANAATREKGRYYLLRLLETDSSADLADMYVGDIVQGVFDKVRAEFIAQRAEAAKEARAPVAIAQPAPVTKPMPVDVARAEPAPIAPRPARAVPAKEEPRLHAKSHAGLWVAAGAGLLTLGAAGATAYYIFERDRGPTEKDYPVEP